ncbi:hypothetical protein [Halovivax cerinus]|uniref:Lipoprotein n=1 Tax=Halovivax cerinus TaxID=1487865 RepID=A0ABD5NRI9_9EURY|nr:hypothetical protein [Halovivax cerinus]
MNKRKLLAVTAIAVVLLTAGCSAWGNNTSGPSGDKLAEGAGTDLDGVALGESYMYEVKITEKNQAHLVQERPPFEMSDSLERQNLIKRYEYLNDRSNVHHVYMLSHDGKVINYEVAQGKVSSVNSKLTNDKQLVKVPDAKFDGGNGAAGANGANYKVVESPQMDGSYGTNGDAIFFFTTDGHYMEWNGLYVVSEEPKEITTEITLVDEVEGN